MDKLNFKLIIGLGNPEKKYQNTYHNVGYQFIDYLISKTTSAKFQVPNSKPFKFLKLKNLILVRPLVPMNQSGIAVKAALNYFNLQLKQMLIVQDDSDIQLGKFKLSFNRGSAGHLGIESIFKHLNTKKIYRLRIGIRSKNQTEQAGKFVLKKINQKQRQELIHLFEQVSLLLNFGNI